jgi:CHAT domain-containing protein/Tfp pilus assembly protein PilF
MEWKGSVCLLLLALAGPGSVCAAEDAPLLQVGVPVSRELNGGRAVAYRLTLKTGDYAHLEVVQKGIDLVLVMSDPAGAVLAEIDNFGRYNTEAGSLVAETSGDFRIEIRPFSDDAAGSYRLLLEIVRPATPQDRLRVAAEKADCEARQDQDPERARTAVERWREAGDRQGEAWALTRQGQLQISTGQHSEGLATSEQALAFHRSSGNREGIAESLYQIAKASAALGDRSRAFSAHQEAISLWQELDQPELVARALIGAGRSHAAFGETEAALAAYEKALAISREKADRNLEAEVLNETGVIHRQLGQPQKSLNDFRSALDLVRATKNRSLETKLRNNLGAIFWDSSPRAALQQFAATLQIYQETNQAEEQASALNNLGNLLLKLGAPEQAREFLLRALPLGRTPRNLATILLGLGRAESELGNLKEAQNRLDEALKLQRSVADRTDEAQTLRVQGFLFLAMGEPAQARQAFGESLRIMKELGDRTSEVSALRGLARSDADLGDVESARLGFEDARKQAEDMGNLSEQALVLAEAGLLEHKAGRLPEARARLESAIQLVESFQSEIGGESLRAQHFAKVRETYEHYVDVLMQLHRATPDAGLRETAFEAAERSRARRLLDVLTRAQVDTQDGDPRLKEEELQLRLELNAKAAARMALPPGPEREAIAQEIQALSAQYQVVEAQLTSQSRYADLTQPSVRVPDIQRLLDDGTVLFEYLLGEGRSYLWVVTRDSLTAHELPARSEIESLARQVHESLSSPSERDASDQRRVLRLLSTRLIAPFLDGLGGKRLAIVADGPLQYVPFTALPISEDPSAPLLIAEHEIVMLSSAAVLKEIRRMEAERKPSPLSLAIFADPVYLGSEPTAPMSPSVVPTTLRGTGLERLSWSRREAEEIAAEADGHKVLKALAYEATRELALSDEIAGFRLIHFATHGFVDSDHPYLSGLALSEIDRNGHKLQGHLLLQDLYSLHLQADLVVLSACETGLGRDMRGEGILGLTHGFLHAGASQVIASLWPVRDRAAAELMQRLYRAMLRDGMRPSAALRTAQLQMQMQRTWRDPYFWAAFVAQGDWMAGADTADRVDTPATP